MRTICIQMNDIKSKGVRSSIPQSFNIDSVCFFPGQPASGLPTAPSSKDSSRSRCATCMGPKVSLSRGKSRREHRELMLYTARHCDCGHRLGHSTLSRQMPKSVGPRRWPTSRLAPCLPVETNRRQWVQHHGRPTGRGARALAATELH